MHRPGGRSSVEDSVPARLETTSNVDELLAQGRRLHGFWTGLAQLPMSHPFTVRRLEHLFRLGLLHKQPTGTRTAV